MREHYAVIESTKIFFAFFLAKCIIMAPAIRILFILLAASCFANGDESVACRPTADGRKLHIALYYESLCPYCKALVTDQLVPLYDDIKNQVELLFVPFGKSRSENNGKVFHCQHGAAECTQNRIQSCVLDAIDYEQDASVRFVGCQMNQTADATGGECARLVDVPYATLLACQNGPKGIELQLKAENQTHEIARPYPKFVPFVVYNHILNEDEQTGSVENLKRVICEKLGEIYCVIAMPTRCWNYLSRRFIHVKLIDRNLIDSKMPR